jgi:hypothetical protein
VHILPNKWWNRGFNNFRTLLIHSETMSSSPPSYCVHRQAFSSAIPPGVGYSFSVLAMPLYRNWDWLFVIVAHLLYLGGFPDKALRIFVKTQHSSFSLRNFRPLGLYQCNGNDNTISYLKSILLLQSKFCFWN